MMVDTSGLMLDVVVHAANIADTQGGQILLDYLPRPDLPRLTHI